MTKSIPVTFNYDHQRVIGRATVLDNGTVECVITDKEVIDILTRDSTKHMSVDTNNEGTIMDIYTQKQFDDLVCGLYAYDTGSRDSGIHDAVLKEKVKNHFQELWSDDDLEYQKEVLGMVYRLFLNPEAREQGYSEEDAAAMMQWIKELANV